MNGPIGKDCQVEEGLGHAFLILSRSDQTTMVLQTGQEINELDKGQSGFITDGPTVFCGNLGKLLGTTPILRQWQTCIKDDYRNYLSCIAGRLKVPKG